MGPQYPSPLRRVYHFTPPEFALENLQRRHLKVSRFSQCNDPFELASFDIGNKPIRRRFLEWLADMDKHCGLLCFCRTWRNPVMWAHYAGKHSGVCYGFDVDPSIFVDVRYVSQRLYPNLSPDDFFEHIGEDQMVDLFATKFIHWSYEEEVRLLVSFSEQVSKGKTVFHPFSEKMKLREVIVGPQSDIKISEVRKIVPDEHVDVFKSRLAFKRFEIVRQKDESLR